MSTLVVDGGAVADVEGNIHTWHGARGQRPLPRKLRGADPVLAPHQKGRPVPTAWPEMFWSRVEVEACLATLGDQSNCRGYPVAERVVLDWLEAREGENWQQRWLASGADADPAEWISRVPRTGPRGGSLDEQWVRQAVARLIRGRVVRPRLPWLVMQHYHKGWTTCLELWDPQGAKELEAAFRAESRSGAGDFGKARNAIARIMAWKGGAVGDITPGDCAEYWWSQRGDGARARGMKEGPLFYSLLFEMGVFGEDAPPTLTAATRPGQLTCEGLIDRYGIECKPVRDLLVDYVRVRQPGVDYTSLRNIAHNLGGLFWKDLEEHHPGIDSLHLAPEVAAGWTERLRFWTRPDGTVRQRKVPENTLAHVRSFYLDVASWAAQDPVRWGPLAAPCPVRAGEISFTKRRRHRKAEMDQRTRTLAPVLPALVRTAAAERERTHALLETALAVADGEEFGSGGRAWVRQDSQQGRVFVVDKTSGESLDLRIAEERAFWAWAIIETLRHTGIRIEEMLELTHHSFCAYTLPTTGEVVPMLQIAPSKTDTERLLLVAPELGEVLAAVIERVRAGRQSLPLVALWDTSERSWSPLMPFLFQRCEGRVNKALTRRYVSSCLDRTALAAGLSDAGGRPLRFTPHDFRRIFATDALRAGIPPHIAAKILGHADLNTTMGYAAVYPEDTVTAHRAFIARRRQLRPGEEYRELSPEEWEEFLGHFELRKVALGVCTRDFGAPCVHEHACVRCPALRPDPAQHGRLTEILANLRDRLAEAEQQGWHGEITGLEVSIAGAEQKLHTMSEMTARHGPVHLGMPDFHGVVGRLKADKEETACS